MSAPLDERAVRYLLGELSPEEEAAMDERLLGDEEAVLELELAEAELHEQAARGELSPARRAAFAERCLERPEQRLRAAVTRGLVERARKLPVPPRTPFWRRLWLPGAAALAMAVAVTVVLVIMNRQAPRPLVAAVLDVELPSASRGSPLPEVVVGRGERALRLRPEVNEAPPGARFRLTLELGGAAVAGPVEAATPVLEVPTRELRPGLYTLRVEVAAVGAGFEMLGFFELRLSAQPGRLGP